MSSRTEWLEIQYREYKQIARLIVRVIESGDVSLTRDTRRLTKLLAEAGWIDEVEVTEGEASEVGEHG